MEELRSGAAARLVRGLLLGRVRLRLSFTTLMHSLMKAETGHLRKVSSERFRMTIRRSPVWLKHHRAHTHSVTLK